MRTSQHKKFTYKTAVTELFYQIQETRYNKTTDSVIFANCCVIWTTCAAFTKLQMTAVCDDVCHRCHMDNITVQLRSFNDSTTTSSSSSSSTSDFIFNQSINQSIFILLKFAKIMITFHTLWTCHGVLLDTAETIFINIIPLSYTDKPRLGKNNAWERDRRPEGQGSKPEGSRAGWSSLDGQQALSPPARGSVGAL